MPPTYFPLRWESTGDQWWYASPIDWAAANGHYDLVRELLHLDTNLLIKLTSLRRIRRLETVWDDEEQFEDVAKCRSQIARKLLLECENRRGPQKNSLIRAGYGGWLLYTAASAGDVEFVNQLLGIDPFLVFGEGEYGVTDVFYAAARSKNPEVFRLLLDFSISPRFCERGAESESVFRREMMNRAVHAAARGGNVVVLRELLKECSDVLGYRDAQGSTLLHSAACRGQLEVVKDLLASYDNIINSKDNHGNTALHVAAYGGHLSILDPLISASPSLTSSTNNNGETFLHMAVSSFRPPGFRRVDRQMDLMKHLLSGKIVNIHEIVNHRNNDGITALHLAVIDNVQTDLVELLMLANSINLNIRDSHGMTPLDLLRRRPRSASSEILIRRLISAGGIANCRDLISRNALASSLKLQGIGGSPGTSFGIPDSEIVTYTAFDNGSESYSYSGELSQSNSVSGALSSAARRLKILLQWPRKNEKFNKDDDSLASFEMCRDSENSGIPLRDSENVGIPLRQRFSMRNNHPSPLTKKKFSAGLMHGVIQVTPQSSPSSPFSESSSSWVSPNKPKGLDIGKSIAGPLGLHRRQTSFNKRLMNGYLCFGSQGLAIEDSISCT